MIAYKLRRTHLIERKKENAPSTIVRNLEGFVRTNTSSYAFARQ